VPSAVTPAEGRRIRLDTNPRLRNLDHTSGRASRRAPPRSLEDLGTSAKHAPWLANSEWTSDLEYVWRMRTGPELARLDARATSQRRLARRAATPTERVTLDRSAEWAEHRAQAMAMPRAAVVGTCGKRWRSVQCGCGTAEVPVGCDQVQLCQLCAKTHWRRWRKRITRAMDAHLRGSRSSWRMDPNRRGMMPGIYLITFTMPHSGSIMIDREAMGNAWRALSKVANAGGWWGHYALTWEVTPGTKGDGHVHMHAAVISAWVPYDALREAWAVAMPGSIQPDVRAPNTQRSKPAQSAADYLAKYVTKGVDPSGFTGQKAGELLVAFRGKRKVTTSLGFWRPTKDREIACPRCGQKHRSLGAPVGIARIAPGAVLRGLAERRRVAGAPGGWWVPRGGVQCKLLDDSG